MARQLRVECPGVIYHVMNPDQSGSARADLPDRQRFPKTLAELRVETGWLPASLDFKWQITDLCQRQGHQPEQAAAKSFGGHLFFGATSR